MSLDIENSLKIRFKSKFKNFYVLGDSISDNGGQAGIFGIGGISYGDVYHKNRSFSDGPTAVEQVAENLEVDFESGWRCLWNEKKYEKVGQNYAVSNTAAADYPKLTSKYIFNQHSLKKQLKTLTTHHPELGEKDLVLIEFGSNDLKHAYERPEEAESIIANAVTEILSAIQILQHKGVPAVIVANVTNLGLIPVFNKDEKTSQQMTKLSNQFNAALSDGLEKFRQENRCPFIIKELNLYSLLETFIQDAEREGWNFRDAAASNIANQLREFRSFPTVLNSFFRSKRMGGYYYDVQKKAKEHVFYDEAHVTEEGHRRIAVACLDLIDQVLNELSGMQLLPTRSMSVFHPALILSEDLTEIADEKSLRQSSTWLSFTSPSFFSEYLLSRTISAFINKTQSVGTTGNETGLTRNVSLGV